MWLFSSLSCIFYVMNLLSACCCCWDVQAFVSVAIALPKGNSNMRTIPRRWAGPQAPPVAGSVANETEIVPVVFVREATATAVEEKRTMPRRGFYSSSSSNNKNHHDDRIIFGTAAIGKAAQPLELLDAAYEKGFRRFDLARSYGGGASEQIFGQWMEDRGIDRTSVDVTTKGGMGQDKYGNPNRPVLTRDALQAEVRASLDALRTDYVDLYLFHRDDPRIDVTQFVLWANELVLSGKAKRWGVSNWSFHRFRQAYEFATANGLEPPRANSPQLSLAVPKCEVWPTTETIAGPRYAKQIRWYEKNGIELLCWEVLAKGFMAKPHLWSKATVNFSSLEAPVEIGSDEWRLQRLQKAYCHDGNYRRRRIAVQLANKLGYKLSQIAVLYPLSLGKNVCVIFGSTSLEHLDDMVGLQHCQLDDEAEFRRALVD